MAGNTVFFSFGNSNIKTQVNIMMMIRIIINTEHFIYNKLYSKGLIYVHSFKCS